MNLSVPDTAQYTKYNLCHKIINVLNFHSALDIQNVPQLASAASVFSSERVFASHWNIERLAVYPSKSISNSPTACNLEEVCSGITQANS